MTAADLSVRLGHSFADPALLQRALTHSSHGNGAKRVSNNESLEFLGDRVLGLLVAERLFHHNPHAAEGDLARTLNALVNRDACADVARRAGLDEDLILSKSEAKSGGRDKPSILGDVTEAVMAALYLDGGLPAARQFFDRYWPASLPQVGRDPKTALQEWAQARGRGTPVYALVGRSGPDHAPMFDVEVTVTGFDPAQGQGMAKQSAERAAAAAFLNREDSPS